MTPTVPEALEQLRSALLRCDNDDRRDMTLIALGYVIGAAFENGIDCVALTRAMFPSALVLAQQKGSRT